MSKFYEDKDGDGWGNIITFDKCGAEAWVCVGEWTEATTPDQLKAYPCH